jgi:hypothetical protein
MLLQRVCIPRTEEIFPLSGIHRPDDGRSKFVWNVDQYVPDYTQ